MDEPFSSLDDQKRADMRDLLRALLQSTQTTLILVTHSRDDALDLARRTLVLEHGQPVAQGPLESILLQPRHVAAVRAFGLGQIIEGEIIGSGEAVTAFGIVTTTAPAASGRVHLLIRPSQPVIVSDGQGVEAEVMAMEIRPPDTREIRRVAVVRVAGKLLRVFLRDESPVIGNRVHVRIEGACDTVEA
jgi:ABC-type sulfate/molybdate transport systems ATPase subunit